MSFVIGSRVGLRPACSKPISLVLISTLAAVCAFAQTPAARPAFEVAAIRPSTTPIMQALSDGSLVGLEIKPDRVRVGHLILSNLILTAYNIKRDQLEGPDWLVSTTNPSLTMFDIEAKLPEGATADQVPLMLQSLLADRFKMTIRRGSKQLDGYVLVAGKSGPKLQAKESPGDKLNPADSGKRDEKGRTIVVMGQAKLMLGPDGGAQIETSTVAGLVDYLSIRLTPTLVLDKTGLQGNFEIKMDLPPLDSSGLRTGAALDRTAELEGRAIDQLSVGLGKLGLKLERQKTLMETIIVERIEKTPTEN